MPVNFEKKKINKEIDKAINEGFSIDTSDDASFLKDKEYSWDDLNRLKTELGNSVLDFVGQVNTIITNRTVIYNLGDKKHHFEKLINIFFTDINNFSNKVKDLRVQHEHRTGHVNDINEFNLYNRLAIQYHALFTELSALITPTLSDILLTISETVPNETVTDTAEKKE